MIIDYEREITQFVADETGWTIGDDIVHGHFLEISPATCNAVLFNAGNVAYFDLPDRIDAIIQIVSRAEAFDTARENNNLAYTKLHRRIAKDLPLLTSGNENIIQISAAINAPRYIGIDDNKKHQWSSDYILRLKIKE